MALPININDLINGRTVEWERLEFKKGWNPEDVIHTICAFANDFNNWGGGYIVIGIEEVNHRPLLPPEGLKQTELHKIQKELLNLCHRIHPNYFPIAEPAESNGKTVLIIWVPGGPYRPYQAPQSLSKDSPYAYYIRRFNTTVKAKKTEEAELFSLAATIPFDDRINHHSEITDLKLPLIQDFLKDAGSELYNTSTSISFEELCRQMAIVEGPPEYLKPRNIGLLLFNDHPEKIIPCSRIEIVIFPESVSGDKITEKIFEGPIHYQIRNALTYLQNMIIKEHIRKMPEQPEAIRFYNYPYIAIKEALVNAMYHRSYEIREPVEVRVNPDSINILSFPGPDRSIKDKDLKTGKLIARRYRNRRLGEFFKELELTEGRCTGIPKMIHAMKVNGSPPPIFETDEERAYFLTTLPLHRDSLPEEPDKYGIPDKKGKFTFQNLNEVDFNNFVPSLSQVCPKSVPGREAALILLKAIDKASLTTLMETIGKTNKTRFRKDFITPLLKSNLLELTIPDKPRSSKQKYRTSKKVLELLQKNR